MKELQKKHMVYNYCEDRWRFREGLAKECMIENGDKNNGNSNSISKSNVNNNNNSSNNNKNSIVPRKPRRPRRRRSKRGNNKNKVADSTETN